MKRAPLSRLCLRNGAHTTYAYDRGGRLTRLANAHTSGYLGVSFDYEYDANSNITRIAQDFNGVDVAHEYAYDELNRLTREKTCDYDDAYSYDNVGNRTALTRVAGGVTKATAYSHNAAHELTQLVYDENGTAQYTKTYGYDAAGRTTRVTKQGGGLTTVVHTYDWDAADRLTRAQVDTGGNVKTIEYAYNAAGLRVRRVDTSTNVTKLYSYQGHNLASIQKSQSGAYTANEWAFTVAPGMIANALERHQVSAGGGATTSQYYQYDHRGNVVAVTDSSGDIQYGYQYDAFGNVTFSFDEGAAAAPTDDILFTGKDLDPDTGLYCFNARWYDSKVGRFLSTATRHREEEHPYVYCENAPMTRVDPKGEQTGDIVGCVLGVVAGVVICSYFGVVAIGAKQCAALGCMAGGILGDLFDHHSVSGFTKYCLCRRMCNRVWKDYAGAVRSSANAAKNLAKCLRWCEDNYGGSWKENPYTSRLGRSIEERIEEKLK